MYTFNFIIITFVIERINYKMLSLCKDTLLH